MWGHGYVCRHFIDPSVIIMCSLYSTRNQIPMWQFWVKWYLVLLPWHSKELCWKFTAWRHQLVLCVQKCSIHL